MQWAWGARTTTRGRRVTRACALNPLLKIMKKRDPAPAPVHAPHKELIHRLRKRRCELCEHGATAAVHQVAGLAHLGKPGPGQPAWAVLMARMRRKTLIVCAPCHEWIHANPVPHAA